MLFKLVAFAAIASQLVAGTAVVNRDDVIHIGKVIFFHPGLGACGLVNTDNDFVAALGAAEFDSGLFCGQKLTVTFMGRTVTVTVVDRCVTCGKFDIALSPAAFGQLSPDGGVLNNVQWHFLE